MHFYGKLALVVALSTSVSACHKRKYNIATVKSERPTAPDQCGEPGQPGRPNPAHCEGPFHIDGPYALNDQEMVRRGWAGEANQTEPFLSGLFGTTTLYDMSGAAILNPRTGKPRVIRDLHYHLGGGRVGLRPIPVVPNSNPDGKLSSGEPIRGSEVLDRMLRQHFGFAENNNNADLFALAAYLYPSNQLIHITGVAQTKSQGSIGHMALYIGNGQTRHAPKNLHNNEWEVVHKEPSTIITVRMKDADQAMLNRNMVVISRLLNELNGGPQFPKDYTVDPMRIYNLQAMFEFFRKWIVGGEEVSKLKNDVTWATYCAEHATLAANLGLNLPLTKAYFERIWPNGVGTQLWAKLQERYREVFGNSMPRDLIADNAFKPLWERDGHSSPLTITEPSKSMAWPLDTTADLISALIENYGAWPDVKPNMSLVLMLNFAHEASLRVGVQRRQFLELVQPIAVSGFRHHVSTMPSVSSREAYDAYINDALSFFTPIPPAMENGLIAQLRSDSFAQSALALPKVSPEQAWKNHLDEIAPHLQKARAFNPPFTTAQHRRYIEEQIKHIYQLMDEAYKANQLDLYYPLRREWEELQKRRVLAPFVAPPSLAFRVANGLRPAHPALDVQVVGTAFHAGRLTTREKGKTEYFPEDLPPKQRPPVSDWATWQFWNPSHWEELEENN